MNGGKNRQPRTSAPGRAAGRPVGYTIVEVMIVLAISGVMFLIASVFINGKQARTTFTAGVNEMASNIQDVVEQVTDGQYSDIPLTCAAGRRTTIVLSGSHAQGTSANCMFLGKMFLTYGSTYGAGRYFPTTTYSVLSFAGSRLDAAGNPVTDVTDANPGLISSLTTDATVPQSLQIKNVVATPFPSPSGVAPTAASAVAFGFLQSLQGQGQGSGLLTNGAQTVQLYYYSSSPGIIRSALSPLPGSPSLDSDDFVPAQSIDICLSDGTRYAEILLGTGGSQLNANIKWDETTPCAS